VTGKEQSSMWDTHEEHVDVISYPTANTLLLNYAQNVLMLYAAAVTVCSENDTKDTKRRVLCSCVEQQVTSHSVDLCLCVCVCVCAQYF
jgi:hypothetical protein